jgi:hypothetical protein
MVGVGGLCRFEIGTVPIGDKLLLWGHILIIFVFSRGFISLTFLEYNLKNFDQKESPSQS